VRLLQLHTQLTNENTKSRLLAFAFPQITKASHDAEIMKAEFEFHQVVIAANVLPTSGDKQRWLERMKTNAQRSLHHL
jgi:hypothetical protein